MTRLDWEEAKRRQRAAGQPPRKSLLEVRADRYLAAVDARTEKKELPRGKRRRRRS